LPRKAIIDANSVLIPPGFDFPPGVEHSNIVHNLVFNKPQIIKSDVSPRLSSVSATSTISHTQGTTSLTARSTKRSHIDSKKTEVVSKDIKILVVPVANHSVDVRQTTMTVLNSQRSELKVPKEEEDWQVEGKVDNEITAVLARSEGISLSSLSSMELLLNKAALALRHLESDLSSAEEAYVAKHGQRAFQLEVNN
jgi:hypothetical protein